MIFELIPYTEFTDQQLMDNARTPLVFDIECYYDYYLVAFKHPATQLVVTFEIYRQDDRNFNYEKLRWVIWNYIIIGFNSKKYDMLMLALGLTGADTLALKGASDRIIQDNLWISDFEEEYKLEVPRVNHIDLIEVCPLSASLKLYGGRLNCERMQDLPFPPDARLSRQQADYVRHYCINDLDLTILIWVNLKDQMELRYRLSDKYNQDLRSKSDAQIAEAVISHEVGKLSGEKIYKPKLSQYYNCRYDVPDYMQFHTPELKKVLELVRSATFSLGEGGSPLMPDELKTDKGDDEKEAGYKFDFYGTTYKVGMGGLHSCEKTIAHKSDDDFQLIDRDVASYYPRIILNLGLYPSHLGPSFLQVYNAIVEQRLAAKKSGNSIDADALKITINGGFGKFGSKYSVLYSPDLLLAVTLTGQLSLLMLIEMLELSGIHVISANTDGIVIKAPRKRMDEMNGIISHWEKITRFETEETQYDSLYSRDINNYIAVKPGGKVKLKGAYADPWSDPKAAIFRFHKNPATLICTTAVCELITKGIPVEKTIKDCRDITRFISIKNVKGGGNKNGVYLGKAVRWYYSKDAPGPITYVGSGNKVGKSDGAKPCMDLPKELPEDIDYDWYYKECVEMLFDLSYYQRSKLLDLFD
ncbi:DNA polymerase II [Erwinia phage AH03]|uniref:DNA polymerase II n=1 Tax=Erwinia phage AH03 TaxID=2869568 RepID=A0AAE7X227_9CAUD|nr:DNA polymerase II [Erwinia phage AH03]